jgi:histidyl-tRNA synthetase
MIKAPRGTSDIRVPEIYQWQELERRLGDLCRAYGYSELRTPIFEATELFSRGVGEGTDIVDKEMYNFKDRGGRNITLRPEGTAPVVRAFLEHKLNQFLPSRLFYLGPMFRYERPQAGRMRQFHQFGFELFGAEGPLADVEVIDLAWTAYGSLGIEDVQIKINSLGCQTCRSSFREELKKRLQPKLQELCDNCQSRYERNPLRILDCKSPQCQAAASQLPQLLDFLCPDCRQHFQGVQEGLAALKIPVEVEPNLVRGFDYYTQTVFEVVAPGLGAKDAIGGGGRYNNLVRELGGPQVPAVGFAAGLERTQLVLEKYGIKLHEEEVPFIYIAPLGARALALGFTLGTQLRHRGVPTYLPLEEKSLKAQMKVANRHSAKWTLILGEQELERQQAILRKMADGTQQEIPLAAIVETIYELYFEEGSRK